MNTPIADFVKNYAENNISRLHMPGHKGSGCLGIEKYDITEIKGADVLSEGEGIIGESEHNASMLFGTKHTFYVTQGSTTAICAMLSLVKKQGIRQTILAARNVHKAFIHACALLDYDVCLISPESSSSIIKCEITPQILEKKLLSLKNKPSAVYLTSPDYLGNLQDIKNLSAVCKKYKVPLMVDNAHGAYLGFLEENLHPIQLGADVCCDSAHKTLPVLTGGAYLHVSKNAPESFLQNARRMIALFSSTSPSYLVMQSLDLCNAYLDTGFKEKLLECIHRIEELKDFISQRGFFHEHGEPLKITINASASGYSGYELAEAVRSKNAELEFYDRDYLVLMLSPQNTQTDFERIKQIFSSVYPKKAIEKKLFKSFEPERAVSIREAVFSESVETSLKSAIGKICAEPLVSCPPAVPIAISGEVISPDMAEVFEYYNIETIKTIKSP